QRFAAVLAEGARLEYVPDHLIPSPGARLEQRTDIALGSGASLLLADAWAVGRVARGERWQFAHLDLALRIRDERGLLLTERCVLGSAPRDGLGGTEGFGYVGTFVAIHPARADWDELCGALLESACGLDTGARIGVSALARGGLLARLLCPSAFALDACV